ncbi:hypothetical protein DMENIID0001_112160 [Sergentomyia squamirostris]
MPRASQHRLVIQFALLAKVALTSVRREEREWIYLTVHQRKDGSSNGSGVDDGLTVRTLEFAVRGWHLNSLIDNFHNRGFYQNVFRVSAL